MFGCLGNLIWMLTGGLVLSVSWFLVGVAWCISIVGIPVGLQCFKIARVAIAPFGIEIIPGNSAGSFLLNLLWIVFGGLALAIEAVIIGVVCYLTIIGIPFGKQCFKLAQVSMMPFGSSIVPDDIARRISRY